MQQVSQRAWAHVCAVLAAIDFVGIGDGASQHHLAIYAAVKLEAIFRPLNQRLDVGVFQGWQCASNSFGRRPAVKSRRPVGTGFFQRGLQCRRVGNRGIGIALSHGRFSS